MNKIDPGQAITILANVGVIIGIGFLALELSQNNDLLAAQARYNLIVQRAAMNDSLNEPFILDALHKSAAGAEMTPVEQSAIFGVTQKLVEMWEWQFNEYQAGMLDVQQLPTANWRRIYRGDDFPPIPVRENWEILKGLASPEFVQFMEESVVNEH